MQILHLPKVVPASHAGNVRNTDVQENSQSSCDTGVRQTTAPHIRYFIQLIRPIQVSASESVTVEMRDEKTSWEKSQFFARPNSM